MCLSIALCSLNTDLNVSFNCTASIATLELILEFIFGYILQANKLNLIIFGNAASHHVIKS